MLKTTISLFALLCILSSTSHLSAQTTFSITGKVYSQKDSSALSNAHIFLDGTSIGTTSNDEGEFKFTFDREHYKGHRFVVTYLSKKPFHTKLSQLNAEYLYIYLKEDPALLAEVQVSSLSAKEIMRLAVDHIEKNYSSSSLNFDLHYKEFRSRNDSALTYMEIASNLISEGFSNKRSDRNYNKVSIKGKRTSINRDDQYDGENGLFVVFWCNWAKNYITKKALRKYNYKNLGLTNYQDHKVYKIEAIRSNQGGTTHIYIDQNSYAFVAFQYQFENKELDMENLNGTWGFTKGNLELLFRNNGEYWHIASIDDFRESIDSDGDRFSSKRSIRIVNVSENVQLDDPNKINHTTNLFDYSHSYNPEFWNTYNAPLPSKFEIDFIERLKRK
jgi:hypothetical protein